VIHANEDFDGTWPFAAHYFEGRGFRQHYVDEGLRDTGETFLLLHGEPTWGYIFRRLIPALAQRGRVVVPDHMGFGKSETPQDRAYSLREHTENLAALVESLGLEGITLVTHDWGGPIGGQFTLRTPSRVKRTVLMDTFMKAMLTPENAPLQPGTSTRWMKFIRSEHFEPVMSHLGETILSVMHKIGLNRTEIVDDTWLRAFGGPFPTTRECKGALQFPRNLLLPNTWEYMHEGEAIPGALDALASKPSMLIIGADDDTTTVEGAIWMFKALWPDGPTAIIAGAHHFVTEDAPETVLALIETFVQSNP